MYLFGKTWQYSEDNRKMVVVYWTMFVIANIISLTVQPFVMAKIVNTIQVEGVTSANLTTLVLLMVVTVFSGLAFWALHGPARCIERNNAFKVRLNYRKYFIRGIMTLPLEWHVDHHSGDTIDRIEKGTNALYSFSEDSFEMIYAIVQLVVCYSILVYLSGPSALIVLVMILVSCCITVAFDKVLALQYRELNRSENQVSESVFDAVSNISTVIILRVEKYVYDAIVHKTEKPFDLFRANQRLNEWKWFLASLLCTLMTALVLSVYFYQNLNSPKALLLGNLFLLVKYLDRISDLFFRFTGSYGDVIKWRSRVQNAEDLSQDFRQENFSNHVLPPSWQRVEVSDLSFSYPNGKGEEYHLKDISFAFRRGERIALVGGTGSGKTTFLKIMRDLYHPKKVTLKVDGNSIQNGFEGISRAISLVPQDPEIFANTILSNITMGAEYDIELVRKYSDMACFTPVALNLPNKYDSSIKEKGVNLSGGEQQRLALTRGLLACHDKDIVLLDEPTKSLDTVTAETVYRNIFHSFERKTIISTIHDIHLLPLFDRICVFDKGSIVASGSLSELLRTCPKFISLWETMRRVMMEKRDQ
jgi:ABC-type bacteriocin/lantibiotic exporter with double-glycine peptidase domain